ncbi:MAG: hypothetical protein P1U34_04315 [Coxiellaceae bacterium]|nr:hypothetical protein [Coxiellaceae bacterium]
MRKLSTERLKARNLLLALNRASLFRGTDMMGVPLASDLSRFIDRSAPHFMNYTLKNKYGEVLRQNKLTVSAGWDALKPTDMVSRMTVTQLISTDSRVDGEVLLQQIEVVVATKATIDSTQDFDHTTPTSCDKVKGEACLFVMKLRMKFLPDGSHELEIEHQGVHPDLRQRGLMKRSTVMALLELFNCYGDMPVTNHAIHPATALFFATTDEQRAEVKAQAHLFGGAPVAHGEVVCGASGGDVRDDADSDAASDGDSTRAQFEIPCQRGMECEASLNDLLTYHCACLDIPFYPGKVVAARLGDVGMFMPIGMEGCRAQILCLEAVKAVEVMGGDMFRRAAPSA